MLPQAAKGKEGCGEFPTQAVPVEIPESPNPAHSMAKTVQRRISESESDHSVGGLTPSRHSTEANYTGRGAKPRLL